MWDGNEVWLVVAGGTLFFAFPMLYAASFSGFYLPLMMVLWLLMLRAIGIELRGHLDHPLWRQFWDFVFAVASALLAIFFGAALGNVIRGVPINADKYFFEALWTNFLPSGQTGILDWYTLLTSGVAFCALAAHGANYIALKTTGEVQARARHISKRAGWVFAALVIISLVATLRVRPQMMDNYQAHVWGWLIPLIVAGGFSRDASLQDERARCGGVSFFCSVHRWSARRRGLWALSKRAAVNARRGVQPDNLECSRAILWPARRRRLVGDGDHASSRLFHVSLPFISREGRVGRRRILIPFKRHAEDHTPQ